MLHFYSKYYNDKAERMEIDFLLTKPYPNAVMKPGISLLEIKSGKGYSTIPLDKFKSKFSRRVGMEYVLHPKQFSHEGERYYLSLYMSICL